MVPLVPWVVDRRARVAAAAGFVAPRREMVAGARGRLAEALLMERAATDGRPVGELALGGVDHHQASCHRRRREHVGAHGTHGAAGMVDLFPGSTSTSGNAAPGEVEQLER